MKQSVITAAVQDAVWAGTDESLHAVIARLAALESRVIPEAWGGKTSASSGVQQTEEIPYLLKIEGSIGIIEIKGPMTNATSYWDKYDRAATYPAIREALVYAANDQNITQILLDVDSGGGAVSGVADTANLIDTINNKVKPITAFCEGSMFSAAYWLASGAGEIYVSKSAGVGSIGIIGTHMDRSKMYEQMGVNVTVIRAGKFKALANGFEPLTDAARAQIQEGMDASYGVFVQHVADMRGVAYNKADTQMAQGREFYGESAVKADLVDGISSFDDVMSKLQSSVDNQQVFKHNSQNITQGNTMKKALTEQSIAALAAGVVVAASTEAITTTAPGVVAPAAAAAAAGTDGVGGAAPAAVVTEAAAGAEGTGGAAPAAAVTTTAAAAAPTDVVAFLQSQVVTKDAAILAAGVETSGLKAKVADYEASITGLMQIAAKSVNNMRVALGGAATDLSALTATQLLAQHDAAVKDFSTKFVAGGVAAVDAAQDTNAGAVQLDSLESARLNAVFGGKR